MLCEMQSVSSRIWTRVAVFISYNDNNYTTGTSLIRTDSLRTPTDTHSLSLSLYIYIYIYHHVVPLARISLTLFRHFSLSFIASGRCSGLHLVSSHSCCMYVRAGRLAFARPYVGVHRSTSLMSSSLIYIYIYRERERERRWDSENIF